MCPDRRNEEGVGLIAAIFVIVVLALLGTALIRIATTEQSAVNRAMASTHAFYAAEAVRDWGLYQVIAQDNSNLTANPPLTSPGGGLAECDESEVDDQALDGLEQFGTVPAPAGPKDLSRFRAVGICFSGAPEVSRRQVEVRFAED